VGFEWEWGLTGLAGLRVLRRAGLAYSFQLRAPSSEF